MLFLFCFIDIYYISCMFCCCIFTVGYCIKLTVAGMERITRLVLLTFAVAEMLAMPGKFALYEYYNCCYVIHVCDDHKCHYNVMWSLLIKLLLKNFTV